MIPARWFRLKFKDGSISGTDWATAEKAIAERDYMLQFPSAVAKWEGAEAYELTPEEKRRSLLNTITRTIGPRNAAIFLGGK